MWRAKTARAWGWILVLAPSIPLLLSLTPRCLFAEAVTGCQASPAVQAALDRLPNESTARLVRLRALLHQYPQNVYVERADINSITSLITSIRGLNSLAVIERLNSIAQAEIPKTTAQYQALHERNPGDAQLDYLYGLTLVGTRTPEAIKLFNEALKREPSFVLPHLELVTIYTSPVFLDKVKGAANLKSYLDACPGSLAGYQQLEAVGDKHLTTAYIGRYRASLSKRTDMKAILAYSNLWALEFNTRPPSQYSDLRQGVAKDVARIRNLKLTSRSDWHGVLARGYILTNHPKQAESASEKAARLSSFYAPEMDKWDRTHPRPGPGASTAAVQDYYRELLAECGRWASLRPSKPLREYGLWNPWVDYQLRRLQAMEHLDDLPATDVEAAVDELFTVVRESGGAYKGEGVYSLAAEVLSRKHVDPQRLVRLARDRLAMQEIRSAWPLSDLDATKDAVASDTYYSAETSSRFLRYEAEGYLELKDAPKARLAIEQLDGNLQRQEPFIGENQSWRRNYLSGRSAYWGLMGQLAQLHGCKQDAMAYYESALLTRLEANQKTPPNVRDHLADRAHKLFLSLGGTEAAWEVWYGERVSAPAAISVATMSWENVNKPLPPFRLVDLKGRTWTLADLRGKETIITFWATW